MEEATDVEKCVKSLRLFGIGSVTSSSSIKCSDSESTETVAKTEAGGSTNCE